MPINKYFKGMGEDVMSSMKKTYGPKKAEKVFYATSNKQNMNTKKKKRFTIGPSEE